MEDVNPRWWCNSAKFFAPTNNLACTPRCPLLQQVLTLDDRVLAFDGAPQRYATSDKQSINVDFFVKWRIANPEDYYRATGGDELQPASVSALSSATRCAASWMRTPFSN